MGQWIVNHLNEIGAISTILAFIFSVAVLAFSAYRYVSLRQDELKNQRYERYHLLLRNISQGHDFSGVLKLVSQRAFIYELRHFPEYKSLTIRLLESLLIEWQEDADKSTKLSYEIQETIKALK
ncbi:hypothetical protein [Shewanella morhuae]|uniref:DUF4760 domain-containing protein n=1 Tax=Shewanella morhuae TaxID=365591 RepID=A0A380CA19_9GAMM|nr:hypothetical protein [Shewanella morhuae]SUI69804.1 Uncharacterised protein [Shewanella morhuae]SUJ14693.1 Uncharacterised protein [Shewanella morhuae]